MTCQPNAWSTQAEASSSWLTFPDCGTAQDAYLSLPGTTGNYASTPDSAALSITADILRLTAKITANDYTPAAPQTIIGKWVVAGNQRSYLLRIQTTGALAFNHSTDGGAGTISTSTVATGFTDGTTHWVRVIRNAATGDVTFYTSEDGVTYTQLGAAVATAIANILDSTAKLEVGTRENGASEPFAGKVHYAEVYNGTSSTVVAKFDPNDATHGATSFTSSTSEIWTINGTTAAIVGGTNAVILASTASSEDDVYNSHILEISSGTGSGQAVLITDYTGSSKAAVLASSLTTPTDSTSTYTIR